MSFADQPTLDVAAHSGRERDSRVFVGALGYESSFQLYNQLAKRFRLSFNDYAAIVLARFHGLDDPSWTNVGRIDVPNIRGIQLRLEDPDHPAETHKMRFRTDAAHRDVYNQRAHELRTSQPKYLGYILAYMHGEPSVVDLGLTDKDRVLRFAPTVHEVQPGVYEARAS